MIKVSDVVLELIQADELALEALRANFLNLSAYADKINKNVENITFKDVKKGTIVAALARLRKSLPKTPSLYPNIKISNIGVKSSLSVYTYEKTADIQRKIAVLHPFLLPMNDLFSVTEGPSEITIIFDQKSKSLIEKHFNVKPKFIYTNTVAVSAQFTKNFADTPNFIYTLIKPLISKRINLIEIVSTHSEISFVIAKEDMQEVIKSFNAYFTKKPTTTVRSQLRIASLGKAYSSR